MGMSAAQAKLLSLTARRSDINYQLNCLLNAKLGLNTQASDAADMLANSKLNNNIFVMTTSDNTQTELSFSNLAKEGLTLVDAKGRTIVPSSYQSDPNKLASILPASHPAIKSYDGDFITKEKLKKNYVAIPQNSIPIFNVTDPNKLDQKKVKAADGEPTVKTVFKDESDTCLKITFDNVDKNSVASTLWSTMNANYKDYYLLIADKNHSGNWYEGSNTEAGEDKILKTENTQSFSFQKSITEDTEEKFNQAFASELGMSNAYISKMNEDLGLTHYTAYNERKFEFDVTWDISHGKILNRAKKSQTNNDVEYVSNAKQLIAALLKHATMDVDSRGYVKSLNSDANIMLLNDIDLDEMLQDEYGKGGLKEFIEDELQSIVNPKKDSNVTITTEMLNNYYNDSNVPNRKALIAQKDESYNSQSGINFSILSYIWHKYFSNEDKHDRFNEDFTNFIQIDKFTGAIGGGGFAINNLKMDTKNKQFAGMFGTLNGAILDGIWMENAQVLSSDNTGSTDHNAAILAKELTGESWVNVSAKGQQFTINDRKHGSSGKFSTKEFLQLANGKYNMAKSHKSKSDIVNAGWSIVDVDKRSDNNIKNAADKVGATMGEYEMCGDKGYVDCGYAFQSYNNYAGTDCDTAHKGWRSVAADVYDDDDDEDNDKRLISSASGNNVKDGFATSVYYDNNCKHTVVRQASRVGCTTDNESGKIKDDDKGKINGLTVIFKNATRSENSKIRLCRKEDVNSYEDPGIDGSWKNNAKFDDGTSINWDDWNVVDGSYNFETGEYTIVQTHGEETEEYLGAVSLLEFYKNQGVRVESYEDRENGTFTYSAYGYSVDVEYKDDLEKYNSDNYLYKVENNDSSIIIYEREKCVDIDLDNFVFVDDIEALIDKNIKNGVWFIQGASITDSSKFERKSLDEIGIIETTDEEADAIAQAEYERKMREIELREEELDAKIAQLESEDKITNQEIENEQKILKQNIQSSCSTFAG